MLIQSLLFYCFVSFLLPLLLPPATSMSFDFLKFDQSNSESCPQVSGSICVQVDAYVMPPEIQLTKNAVDKNINYSIGRALYPMPLLLWDNSTGELTNFTTNFTFLIDNVEKNLRDNVIGDGVAFFLAPYPSPVPENSSGGLLGLVSEWNRFNASSNSSFVAVEIDTYKNDEWDPSFYHAGIDVNSIRSVKYTNLSENGSNIGEPISGSAQVTYDALTQNLSALFIYNSRFYAVSHVVDLRKVLPNRVSIDFSGCTGQLIELNVIRSWSFRSSLDDLIEERRKNATVPISAPAALPVPEPNGSKGKSKFGLFVGILVGVGLLMTAVGLLWFAIWQKRQRKENRANEVQMGTGEDGDDDDSVNDNFDSERGPQRFPYSILVISTDNFNEERKLGEGGFGAVYRGHLKDTDQHVAIKRISKDSKQGKKEYISEIKIISRLRHRNLVKLIGWCHEHGEFLLVYELMPNGSLDYHLFRADRVLAWPERYNIALGLASALLYLHEEWEQCVVHRDVKSSTKLGDFGLARLVDHGCGLQTTLLAGTMGYMAPECFITCKHSKESDVYSFGIVALEIASGMMAIDSRAEHGKARLVERVWELYGRGMTLEAADRRLVMFNELQMEQLLVVGLWCAHPDFTRRPSIRHVISVLNFEAAKPDLPSDMPVPMYGTPQMQADMELSNTSFNGISSSTTVTCEDGDGYSNTRSSSSTASLLRSYKSQMGSSLTA